jgi:hypothetical protein
MTIGHSPALAAKKFDNFVAGFGAAHGRARLIAPARLINLAGRDARNSNFGAFFAPNWPITVPNCGGRAREAAPRSDDLRRHQSDK